MIGSTDAPQTGQEPVRRAGHTLWLYGEALRSVREDLSRMGAGMMSPATPLEEGKGSLRGVNHLMAYVAWTAGLEIAPLVDRPEGAISNSYPLTSTRGLEYRIHKDGGDPELEIVLRSYAQLALLFPDMLGPGRGGEKGDFVEVRCQLVPDLLASVSAWLKTRDPARSYELELLVREWKVVTGWN